MKKVMLKSLVIVMMLTMVFATMPHTVSAASKNPGKAKITSFKVGKVSKKTSAATVTVKWKKVSKATGYEVWDKHGTEDWTKLKKVSRFKGGIKIKKVPTGQYSVKVRAIRKVKGKTYYGKFSKAKTKFTKSPMNLIQFTNKYPELKSSGVPGVTLSFSGNTVIANMDLLKIEPKLAPYTATDVKSIANNLYNELGSPEMFNAASQIRANVRSNTGISNARVRFVFMFKGEYITARDY